VEWRAYLTRHRSTKPGQGEDLTVWARHAARFTCSHPAAAPLITLPNLDGRQLHHTVPLLLPAASRGFHSAVHPFVRAISRH
jgi:hypothetical protein